MDTIANMLTAIRNAQAVRKATVNVPYSKMSEAILRIMQDRGFIMGYSKNWKKEKKFLEVRLKYINQNGAIRQLRRISTPGRRLYVGYANLHWPRGVVVVISTPQGVLSADEAKRRKLGGELICEIA